jgi:hypothetical protein
VHGRGRVAGGDEPLPRRLARLDHAQAKRPFRALRDDRVPGEDVQVVEHHVVAGGDDLGGAREVGRLVDRHLDQTEVAPGVVDADDEVAAAVVEVELDALPARKDRPEAGRTFGPCEIEDAHLGRVHARDRRHHVSLVARRRDADRIELVGLVVQQQRRMRALDVAPPEATAALLRVHGDDEERAPVAAPGDRRHLWQRPGERRPGVELAHEERVVAPAGAIERVGEPAGVAAHRRGAEREERTARGLGVEVEQQRFGCLGFEAPVGTRGRRAHEPRVLLARLDAHPVPPGALAVRHRVVVGLDAGLHLRAQRGDQPGVRREPGFGIGVLGLERRQGARVVALPQPPPLVAARVAMDADVLGLTGRDRPRRPVPGAHLAGVLRQTFPASVESPFERSARPATQARPDGNRSSAGCALAQACGARMARASRVVRSNIRRAPAW